MKMVLTVIESGIEDLRMNKQWYLTTYPCLYCPEQFPIYFSKPTLSPRGLSHVFA